MRRLASSSRSTNSWLAVNWTLYRKGVCCSAASTGSLPPAEPTSSSSFRGEWSAVSTIQSSGLLPGGNSRTGSARARTNAPCVARPAGAGRCNMCRATHTHGGGGCHAVRPRRGEQADRRARRWTARSDAVRLQTARRPKWTPGNRRESRFILHPRFERPDIALGAAFARSDDSRLQFRANDRPVRLPDTDGRLSRRPARTTATGPKTRQGRMREPGRFALEKIGEMHARRQSRTTHSLEADGVTPAPRAPSDAPASRRAREGPEGATSGVRRPSQRLVPGRIGMEWLAIGSAGSRSRQRARTDETLDGSCSLRRFQVSDPHEVVWTGPSPARSARA